MFKINAYNIKRNEQNLVLILIVFILSILLVNGYPLYPEELRSSIGYLSIAIWIYLLIWHMKLKKTAYSEELRQFRLGMVKTDKRAHQRYPVSKNDKIRIMFSFIKFIWLFGFKKKRFARPVDISEGGILVRTDTKDIDEGIKAADINIKLADMQGITTDGLVVRVTNDLCAIKFINITNSARDIIKKYVIYREMGLSEEKGLISP